ncbi:MAG: hypothetical protein P8Y97_20185 [Candidatus Lokiarchaeota archaeon]
MSSLFPGTTPVGEINVNGGREDLNFFIPPSNKKLHFEIFASSSQVPQDLRLLENSKSDLQIAILIDKEIDSRISELFYRKKPAKPFPSFYLSELFLEQRIRKFKIEVKKLVEIILKDNIILKDYNKIFEESDEIHEYIYPNIFPFIDYPPKIKAYSTEFNFKSEIIKDILQKFDENVEILPFICRENCIFSFFDLKQNEILKNYISYKKVPIGINTWLEDPIKRYWIIELLNVFIKSYCIKYKNLEFDGDKKRYFFHKKSQNDKILGNYNKNNKDTTETKDKTDNTDKDKIIDKKTISYFTGIKHQKRRLYWSKEDYYVHLAFRLKVIILNNRLFLMILPTYVFTEDGINMIPPEKRSGLYTRYRNKQHNPAVLNSIRFLLSYFSDLEDITKDIEFKINDISLKVENSFQAYKISAGNPNDYRNMYNVLTREEFKDG